MQFDLTNRLLEHFPLETTFVIDLHKPQNVSLLVSMMERKVKIVYI